MVTRKKYQLALSLDILKVIADTVPNRRTDTRGLYKLILRQLDIRTLMAIIFVTFVAKYLLIVARVVTILPILLTVMEF